MFKIKRPVFIGLLVVLLIFTGYLNYYFTQQAQIKSSRDYQKHELEEMARNLEIRDSLDQLVLDPTDHVDIIETAIDEESEVLETMYSDALKESKNYFVEYRLSRDKLRATLVDRLDEIIKDENTSEAVRADAQREIMKLGNHSEIELQIEGLIKSKGYDDAIVFLTNKDIKVVVSAPELGEQDMVKILEIVKSETDFDTKDIKIMKKQ
ncbi:MAG: SpoIIIAH-like family protein [Tissierellia bacterium]|nr:SpoIIIAH-like family protein [Tissierellia bacterium]